MSRRFPHLVPLSVSNDDALTSFPAIRQKTLNTLYGEANDDKSPKGSVDAAIQTLVDLINEHPSYATVSSCSGRISLFDPSLRLDVDADADAGREAGKGAGGWLLASHETINPPDLEALVDSSTACGELIFKFEPMLLHVAASNLVTGQKLLKIALALGFRESGLIATPQRVTVAIRTYSTALSLPLSPSGPLRPPSDFLHALAQNANQRLTHNLQRLGSLLDTIQAECFQKREKVAYVRAIRLPDLNLWGHAAVIWEGSIYTFGGYGKGPRSVRTTPCARTSSVYRLASFDDNWNSQWELITVAEEPTSVVISGIACQTAYFTPRQHVAACKVSIQNQKPFVVLFGGRTSPAKPLDDLLLCTLSDGSDDKITFWKPQFTTGVGPCARWAHSITSCHTDDILALVAGGRTENEVLNSLHALHWESIGDNLVRLRWYVINASLPLSMPLFHHTAEVVTDSIFLFGGISDARNILASVGEDEAVCIHLVSGECKPFLLKNTDRVFGAASATLSRNKHEGAVVLLTGGVAGDHHALDRPLRCFSIKEGIQEYRVEYIDDLAPVFGALVHHQCLATGQLHDGCYKAVVVGGGVAGFAFGQCFANSFSLTIEINYMEESSCHMSNVPTQSLPVASKAPKEELSPALDVPVFFVLKQNAKVVKNMLTEKGLLDRKRRMAPAVETPDAIVLPVTREGLELYRSGEKIDWRELVLHDGNQVLPYSTQMYAARSKNT